MASNTQFPEEIWYEILSNLLHDHHLEPLSLVSKSLLSITNNLKQTLKITFENDEFLPSLFNRFSNLKLISFINYPRNPAPILHQIAKTSLPLETLDLSNHGFPVQGLDRLPFSMRTGLKSFKVTTDSDFCDLEEILLLFPNVEELDLMNSPYAKNLRYRKSELGFKSLRRISLMGSNESLMWLSENCPNLEEIMLKDCDKVTIDGVAFALQTCKNLKSIGLETTILTTDIIYIENVGLCWPRTLTEIGFYNCSVNRKFLDSIVEANLPLKSFTLSHCWGFIDIISFLRKYTSLDYLAVEGINLFDDDICKFAEFLGKVKKIKLNGFNPSSGLLGPVRSGSNSLSDYALFYLMEHCPLLESVEMEKTRLGKGIFRVYINTYVYHPAIRSLKLSFNDDLRSGLVKEIALACPNLEVMELNYCGKIIEVGEIMRNCRDLKELQISGCERVESLGLDRETTYKLEILIASDTKLNGGALYDIADKCPDLRVLDLRRCKWLSYNGVKEVVEKCRKLEVIDLRGCDPAFSTIHRPFLRKIQ